MSIPFKKLSIFSLVLGVLLLTINIYGTFKDIRPRDFFVDDMRFLSDTPNSYDKTLKNIAKRRDENIGIYADRLTYVISDGLGHIKWNKSDSRKYHQLIPIWENYILYFMGKFSKIPEYERYHYTDYKRSLERGIGICGDASMIMSQILDENKIKNKIISFPGHVVVEATADTDRTYIYDADFGVVINHSVDEVNQNPELIELPYSNKGYSIKEIETLKETYARPLARWDGVAHFMTKKYYFEYMAYFLKWPLPVFLILSPILFGFFWHKKTI